MLVEGTPPLLGTACTETDRVSCLGIDLIDFTSPGVSSANERAEIRANFVVKPGDEMDSCTSCTAGCFTGNIQHIQAVTNVYGNRSVYNMGAQHSPHRTPRWRQTCICAGPYCRNLRIVRAPRSLPLAPPPLLVSTRSPSARESRNHRLVFA